MKRLARLLIAVALTVMGLSVGAGAPAQAASTCNVSLQSGFWRATCPTSSPGSQFRLQLRCIHTSKPLAVTRSGAWAVQGSGTSSTRCPDGYRVQRFYLYYR